MAKGEPGKPKGRMTAYAYFVQTCRDEHKKKHPNENVVFAEFSKKCAERWKLMNDKEKQRFQALAEKDKKRYDNEMKDYVPPKNSKKRKRTKDPNAPKRALSAFFWFCNDERPKVRAEQPDSSVGDIAKELGKRWGVQTPEQKKKYEQLATKDKARYEKESTAYKKKAETSTSTSTTTSKAKAKPAPVESDDEEEEDEDEEEEDDDEDDD
jgi:high mobility group protein B1